MPWMARFMTQSPRCKDYLYWLDSQPVSYSLRAASTACLTSEQPGLEVVGITEVGLHCNNVRVYGAAAHVKIDWLKHILNILH